MMPYEAVIEALSEALSKEKRRRHFRFSTHFHPYACEFIKRLAQGGIDAILSMETQTLGNAYLRETWQLGYEISTAGMGSGTIIHDPQSTDPLASGTFYAITTDGSDFRLYSHVNTSETLPRWRI